MTQFANFPTQDYYRQALNALNAFTNIQFRYLTDALGSQKEFVAVWWRKYMEHANACCTASEPKNLIDAMSRAGADEAELLQAYAKKNFELAKSAGEAVVDWYQQQLGCATGSESGKSQVRAKAA